MTAEMVKLGNRAHVWDKKDLQFYECTVVSTDKDRIKVHFISWNKKHDEWLPLDSPRRSFENVMEMSDAGCSQNGSPSSVGSFVATLEAWEVLRPNMLLMLFNGGVVFSSAVGVSRKMF